MEVSPKIYRKETEITGIEEVPFYCGVSITVARVIPQAYSSL